MTVNEAIVWYETKLSVNEAMGFSGPQNDAARLALGALREKAALREQLALVTAERDAAIDRTKKLCYLEYNDWCDNDKEPCDGCASKWRGPQKEDE